MTSKFTTATCSHCQTVFDRLPVERDNDGTPYAVIPAEKCAEEACEVYLCAAGCEHLSFACDGCGARYCNEHKIEDGDLKLCPACAAPAEVEISCPELRPVLEAAATVDELCASVREHVRECALCRNEDPLLRTRERELVEA